MPINLNGSNCTTGKPSTVGNFGKPATRARAADGRPGDAAWWIGGNGAFGDTGTAAAPNTFGLPGGSGGDAGSAVITVGNLNLNPADTGWITAIGGAGCPGGDALTPGGDGQPGGNGGAGWAFGGPGDGGDGGAGGRGAVGGQGGNGGKGGRVDVFVGTGFVPYHSANFAGGKAGLSGQGGPGGAGGAGGRGGSSIYGPGKNGAPGPARPRAAFAGRAGDSGQLWINGVRKVP